MRAIQIVTPIKRVPLYKCEIADQILIAKNKMPRRLVLDDIIYHTSMEALVDTVEVYGLPLTFEGYTLLVDWLADKKPAGWKAVTTCYKENKENQLLILFATDKDVEVPFKFNADKGSWTVKFHAVIKADPFSADRLSSRFAGSGMQAAYEEYCKLMDPNAKIPTEDVLVYNLLRGIELYNGTRGPWQRFIAQLVQVVPNLDKPRAAALRKAFGIKRLTPATLIQAVTAHG